MKHKQPIWFYGMSEMQTYIPNMRLRNYDLVDEVALENYTKPIISKIFLEQLRDMSIHSIKKNLSLIFGRDRSGLVRYIQNVFEYYIWQLATDSIKTRTPMTVEDIKTSTDHYNDRMKDYIVTLNGYPRYNFWSRNCSTLYVQVFAKLVSEVKKTWFRSMLCKYFPKYYHPENDKFSTKFVITERVWIDPIHYYDIYIMDIPVNEKLLTNIHNDYNGEEDYERRVRRIGFKEGLSGI